MELQMPGIDGVDTIIIHAIQKKFPDARIIVRTTYSGDTHQATDDSLTDREIEVLRLIAASNSNSTSPKSRIAPSNFGRFRYSCIFRRM